MKENKPKDIQIFADLEDCKVNGGTLPPDVALTGSRPDLVLIDRAATPQKVYLVELTVTWDTVANTESARNRKHARYEHLSADIEENGFKCFNTPLEVGVRGYLSPRNRNTIVNICHMCNVRRPRELIKKVGKVSLLGSYQIYLARNSQDWTSGGILKP